MKSCGIHLTRQAFARGSPGHTTRFGREELGRARNRRPNGHDPKWAGQPDDEIDVYTFIHHLKGRSRPDQQFAPIPHLPHEFISQQRYLSTQKPAKTPHTQPQFLSQCPSHPFTPPSFQAICAALLNSTNPSIPLTNTPSSLSRARFNRSQLRLLMRSKLLHAFSKARHSFASLTAGDVTKRRSMKLLAMVKLVRESRDYMLECAMSKGLVV